MGWWLNGCVLMMMMISFVQGEDPYRYFDWRVTSGNIYPFGGAQKGILINGKYPGPEIHAVTNDNLIINVHNDLGEPFLLSWNGVQLRKNSYQDGVYGTTCPIPPGKNYTYAIQVKDQIGSFYYFPSLGLHKAAGGFGGLRILSRPRIPVPFPEPAGDFTFLIGDWYDRDYKTLKAVLDKGHRLPKPDAVLINGVGVSFTSSLTVEKGKTYRFRISNVGIQRTLNFRIIDHQMKLVEVEGTHTVQSMYTSLDIHVGQSYSVLVTMDRPPKNYTVSVRTKFGESQFFVSSIIHYANSKQGISSSSIPTSDGEPIDEVDWSMKQARSIRTNLTASGPRPNPQGSYHYGRIKISRTIILESSAALVNKKQRYAINGVSFVPADTPLKLADYFKIKGVFKVGSIPDKPKRGVGMRLDTSVMGANHRDFIEIVFQNREKIVQSYHLDGYSFWVVGMDKGKWSHASRREYNLRDAVSRSTTQVYPGSWTAIYVALDNVGMWNLRSEFWARQYLGQQFYLRVHSPVHSLRDEYLLPKNALLCGRASNKHKTIATP